MLGRANWAEGAGFDLGLDRAQFEYEDEGLPQIGGIGDGRYGYR